MNMHSLVNARESIGYMEKSGANLSQSLKRLSTGIKVDATDAGGLAVSTKMDSVITRTRTLGENVQNGMSFLESQDAAQSKLGAILTRMSELRVRYDDPTMNTSDGANLNREFKELQDDVRTLAQKKFNGISLFSSGSDADSKLVIGANSANPSNIREVTRNQFFNSLLDTQSSGGPVGGLLPVPAKRGSFLPRNVNATGGTASVPGGVVNGLQGSAITSIFTLAGGTLAGGRVADFKVNGLQGTTPLLVTISAPGGSGGPAPFTLTPVIGTTPGELWTKNFAGGTSGFEKMSPVFDSNGDIFVGLNEHDQILKLSAADGSTLQPYDLKDVLLGTGNNKSWKVAVSADTVYAANGDTKELIAFDKTTGAQKPGWPKTLGTAGYATAEGAPFVHSNGNVYVTSNGPGGFNLTNSGKIFGFDPDGTQLFTPLDVEGQFEGGFAQAADGTLIATSKGGVFNHRSIFAFNPTTGVELWHKKQGGTLVGGIGASVLGPPAILGTSVVINGSNNRTRAFNVANGNALWSINIGNSMKGGPTVGNVGGTDTVFVASSNGVVALRDSGTTTPTTFWTSPVLNAENCTPVYDQIQNRVYVTDDVTGKVIALNAADGTQVWDFDIGTPGDPSFASPAVDSNGNVYVGDNNGDFTAISSWEAPVADGIGSGFATAPALSDVVLDPTATNLGTLQVASVTLNTGTVPPAGSLRITFTGKPSGPGSIGVTVAGGGGGGGGTPPAVAVAPSSGGYLLGETPTARVLADGIGDIIADTANPFSVPLSTGLVALIDGNVDPLGGPVSNTGSGPNGTFDAATQEPAHEPTERRSGAGAFTFDGTDDKINLGTLDTQIGLGRATGAKNELTISAWVYHTQTGDHRIVCKSPSTSRAQHIFSLGISNTDALRMRIGTDTTNASDMDGGNIPLNKWTHVAMTYDGTLANKNVKSYINGQLDSEHDLTGNIKSSTTTPAGDNVYIGNVNANLADDRHFKGNLDDVGIWNQALDLSEIAEIAGPGGLTADTLVNPVPTGTLTVIPVGTTARGGDFKVEVEDGTVRAPADLTGTGNPLTPYTPGDPAPTVTLSDLSGTPFPTTGPNAFTATATINDGISGGPPPPTAGTLNIAFAGSPPDKNDVTVQITDGVGRLSNFSVPTSGFAPGETPAVTILDNTGTVVPVAPGAINTSVDGTGTLNGNLSGVRTSDLGNHTVQISAGALRAPNSLTGIGNPLTPYTPGDPAPTVTLSDLSGTPFPTTGPNAFTAAATINDGISGGPPPPTAGTLNIAFAGSPPDKNDVTVQIDNGVGRLSDFSVPASGYAPGETPAVTILDNTGTVVPVAPGAINTSVDGTGTLTVDLSAVRTNVQGNHKVQIAPGAFQTPADVNIGSNHDPANTPTATLSGADAGTVTVSAVTVKSDGTVDVSFAGIPSGTDLSVTVSGGTGTGSTGVSSKYLLDIDGDLWDYSVSEFESFTELVSDARAQNGAEQNSLGTFWDLLSTNVNKLEQAAGRIKDADFAKEMTEVSKSQINTRSAAVMLGKQNRITSEALLTLQNLSNML
jgi:flagellin-like hook-associated protein FlgL